LVGVKVAVAVSVGVAEGVDVAVGVALGPAGVLVAKEKDVGAGVFVPGRVISIWFTGLLIVTRGAAIRPTAPSSISSKNPGNRRIKEDLVRVPIVYTAQEYTTYQSTCIGAIHRNLPLMYDSVG
jgi:hypothetical protein